MKRRGFDAPFSGPGDSWSSPAHAELLPTRYRVVGPISRGGLASVFKVIDTEDGQPRALKFFPLRESTPTTAELFRLEFSRICSFDHPHIVTVYEFGSVGDRGLYFVMEYLDGAHFDEALRGRPFETVVAVCTQICEALSYVHLRGIVHGDMKPANVLVVRKNSDPGAVSGERDLAAKLTDFGLSRVMAEAGTAGGTHAYVAPEVIRGIAIDGRTDLYSFGAMLYELATGSRIFADTSGDTLLRAHLLSKPVPPREINAAVPPQLQNIILRLLEKEPARRYQSAEELARALRQAAGLGEGLEVTKPQPVVLLSPDFVGRDRERSILKEAVSCCRDEGRGAFFLISGDDGVGKSRILEWLRFTASLGNVRVGFVKCGESAESSSGMRFRWSGRTVHLDLAHSSQEGDDVGLVNKQAGAGLGTSSERAEVMSLLQRILPPSMEVFEPCAVILDDIQLASAEFLSNLVGFVSLARFLPLLVVCSCETGTRDEEDLSEKLCTKLKATPGVTELALQGLSSEEAHDLIASAMDVRHGDELRGLGEWIFGHSGGLPLLIEGLLKELSSRGRLKRIGRELMWEAPDEASVVSAPRVPQTLENRLKRLPREEFEILKAASVSGDSFDVELVRSVSPFEPPQLAAAIQNLADRGLIKRSEPGHYVFSHVGTRRLAYGLLEEDTKRGLHAKMASWLEENLPGAKLDELARHHEESGDGEKALKTHIAALKLEHEGGFYRSALRHGEAAIARAGKLGLTDNLAEALEKTADSAERLGKHDRALRLREEQLRMVPPGMVREFVRLSQRMGEIYLKLSRFSEAREKLSEALKAASDRGAEQERAEILADMGWVLFRLAKHDDALACLDEAEGLASKTNSAPLLARIQNRRGVLLLRLGFLDKSEEAHATAVDIARRIGEPAILATCLNNFGLLLLKRGRPAQAESIMSEACERAREVGELVVLSSCYNNLGIARKELRDLDGALDSYLKSAELKKRCGDFVEGATTALNVAVLYRLKGETELALRYNEESFRIASEFASDQSRSISAANIGEIEGMRGNLKEAERRYLEALAIREKSGDTDGVSLCAAGLGQAFLNNGEAEKAFHWATKALESSTPGSRERMAAQLLLAETLCVRGKPEEAQRVLDDLASTEKDIPQVTVGIQKRIRGLISEKSGRLAEAVEVFGSSCSLLGAAGDLLERARSLFSLGRALVLYAGESFSNERARSKPELMGEAIAALEEASRIFRRMEAGPEATECLSLLVNAYRESSSPAGDRDGGGVVSTLLEAAELTNSILPSSVVLERIMDLALEKTGAERGLVVLVNAETGEIEKVLSRSLEAEIEEDALVISRTVVRKVAKGGFSLVAADASMDPELRDIKSVARLEIRSVLCVPLRARNKVIGAVYLDNRSLPGAFGSVQESFMEGFANLAGMAIESSRLREELERANELLNRENIELRKQVASHYKFDQMIGESPQMQKVFGSIAKVAKSSATVLIVGESGTGKELVARAIHFNSPRKNKPFLPVNCASIPRELIEGELFGIEDRVATGVSKRTGFFEQADGGSILLDEIGDMSPDLQSRLLRVLQEKEFKRVGGRHSIKVDVRIICATNKNLLAEMARGTFRSDLYYRISGIPVEIPPLRERRGDIPRLVDFFLNKYSTLYSVEKPPRMTTEMMNLLVGADWEGNVRELENCIERFVVLCSPGEEVPFSLLPPQLKPVLLGLHALPKDGRGRLKEEIADVEKQKLANALIRNNGNRSKTARELGISEQSVRYKIRKYRLNVRQLCRDGLI